MTTRYRVEYALKTHRRDQLIEWIKGLLAVPFVLHSQPTAVYDRKGTLGEMAQIAHRRYAEIMRDVEKLINDHINQQQEGTAGHSKLKFLVPSVGRFFTTLPLEDAFNYQDNHRRISSRRFVAPSFNDIRLVLNTAQLLGLVRSGGVKLVTFDGDVTLYPDGGSLTENTPVISRLLGLLRADIKIGIVTAAGYTDASKYYTRLYGLLDAIAKSEELTLAQKENIIIMGGESNFLFQFDPNVKSLLRYVRRPEWILPEMQSWNEKDIQELLSVSEKALRECVFNMQLPAEVIRKERAVGIVPKQGHRFTREQLEETVLVTQQLVDVSDVAKRIPFCAFNGGSDCWADIGDKAWGVLACQSYFGLPRRRGSHDSNVIDAQAEPIPKSHTLHIGDQFLSAGANDFKARLACTTAWVANPEETVGLLDELGEWMEKGGKMAGNKNEDSPD
ncbi:MAG: IMP 5'-nucleotidase [Cirrosporium novae-zelandiae]|nr:MAG: IMP 5'-nucleotidase [Cirrosporium novae-zelandiae]